MIHERADLSSLEGETFDLAVVGGGIMGTGIARDAALRGLRVILVEKEDFGSGTTSRTSRLIHGGLRYLAHLDVRLVRQDLRERALLLRNAPHLVRPLPFLLPVYGRRPLYRLLLRAGLALYDLLALRGGLPRHGWLGREALLEREPDLNSEGLRGAFLFHDAQAPLAERLCLENALDAAAHGAEVVNHALARGLLRQDGRIVGLDVEDTLVARRHRLSARLVINAAGPWADEVRDLAGGDLAPMVRTTRGVHLIAETVCRHGIVMTARSDGRLFFVLPWLGHSLIGTTDTDESREPGQVQPETEDVAYLLAEARRAFPSLTEHAVLGAYAGVRALAGTDREKESDVSRRPRIVDHAGEGLPGLISVVGGKLTAYRQVAQTATDLACRLLDVHEACTTAGRPLPGAPEGDLAALLATARQAAKRSGLAASTGEYLARVYGSRYKEVLALAGEDPRGGSALCPHTPAIVAQVWHAVDREWARTPADFLLRRTLLGLTPPCFGLDALTGVAEEMGHRLRWSAKEVQVQVETYGPGLGDGAWLQVGRMPESPAADRS